MSGQFYRPAILAPVILGIQIIRRTNTLVQKLPTEGISNMETLQ